MITKPFVLITLGALLTALTSCSTLGFKTVEAEPETMQELGSTPESGAAVEGGDEEPARTAATTSANTKPVDTARLRLPDMESLPSNNELKSGKPEKPSTGVIARPPVDGGE